MKLPGWWIFLFFSVEAKFEGGGYRWLSRCSHQVRELPAQGCHEAACQHRNWSFRTRFPSLPRGEFELILSYSPNCRIIFQCVSQLPKGFWSIVANCIASIIVGYHFLRSSFKLWFCWVIVATGCVYRHLWCRTRPRSPCSRLWHRQWWSWLLDCKELMGAILRREGFHLHGAIGIELCWWKVWNQHWAFLRHQEGT